jgi:hypothetical protein
MASQWHLSDAETLSILAFLRQRVFQGDTRVVIARELRQLTDDFGLTPKGRQQRRWIVTEEDAERAGYATDQVAGDTGAVAKIRDEIRPRG